MAAGTAGLGYACAAALAAEGARVAICGRDPARVEAAVTLLDDAPGGAGGFGGVGGVEGAGGVGAGGAVGIVADLTSPDECERFVTEAYEALDGLDILVVNGPGPRPGTFAGVTPADYQRALEINLLSVMRMCYAAVPGMRAQGWGRVVAITSISVRQPIPNLILSTTARAGATGFLKTLAREVAADGVTVNSVQPGLHETQRVKDVYGDTLADEVNTIPARALGQPADFGAVVTFLCSEQARYITGAAIPVDGGQYQALL